MKVEQQFAKVSGKRKREKAQGRKTREGNGNSEEHRPGRQLTIIAAAEGGTDAPELAWKTTSENAREGVLVVSLSQQAQ